MKKFTIFLLIVMLVGAFAITGCGNDAPADDNAGDAAVTVEPGLVDAAFEAANNAVFPNGGPLGTIEDDAIAQDMFGLNMEWVKDYVIAMPMMNVHADTFIGVEAQEANVADVEAALNAYRDQIIADREAFPYLPDHLPKAQESQVVTIGNYVFFVSMADTSEAGEDGLNDLVKADTEKAVAAINEALGQ
ncbi:MAG: DUF4358 domain-containing protein [Clostridiales bacterium]|nr:DUF4358 domain-containing protein [Clostridiales bacterium]